MDAKLPDNVAAALAELDIAHEVVPCDPDFADTAQFCERYGFPIDNCGNTIIVASKREPLQYASCTVRGSDRLDVNKMVRKLMGVRRLSFAGAEQTAALTGMKIGGVTPFALPEGVPVYFDERLMELDYVILGSGDRSSKIKMSPELLPRIPNAEVVGGLSMPPRPS